MSSAGFPTRQAKVTAVVPAKNEAKNLPLVLTQLRSMVDEVVLVDAGSTDGTVEVARDLVPGLVVVCQRARGKGAALSAGFAAASGDLVVMLDADGSMDPGEIPRFTAELLAGADLVKGSRCAPGGGSTDLTLLRRTGNAALRTLANRLFRQRWSELAYGYAAMWRDVIPALELDQLDVPTADGSLGYGQGFEIETLMFTRAVRAGLAVVEVPSFERDRVHGVSNLRTFPDGWRLLRCMLKEWVRPACPATPRLSSARLPQGPDEPAARKAAE